jgi:hypothetical protein
MKFNIDTAKRKPLAEAIAWLLYMTNYGRL